MKVRIEILDGGTAPTYAHDGDAGADLRASEHEIVRAGERRLVKTGIRIALPEGYAAFVHPRSGLALKEGITVLNTPGTIDAGYRGEIGVILFNTSAEDFVVSAGDRIAQLVIQRVETPEFYVIEGESLDDSERGEGGFGSTGVGDSESPVFYGRPGAGQTYESLRRARQSDQEEHEYLPDGQ